MIMVFTIKIMLISPPSAIVFTGKTLLPTRGYVFTGVIDGKREAARSSISTDFLVPHEVPQHFFELQLKTIRKE